MSDTPRTDRAIVLGRTLPEGHPTAGMAEEWVTSTFARVLERELAEAREREMLLRAGEEDARQEMRDQAAIAERMRVYSREQRKVIEGAIDALTRSFEVRHSTTSGGEDFTVDICSMCSGADTHADWCSIGAALNILHSAPAALSENPAHTDHPPRHYDRTCPGCEAESVAPSDRHSRMKTAEQRDRLHDLLRQQRAALRIALALLRRLGDEASEVYHHVDEADRLADLVERGII